VVAAEPPDSRAPMEVRTSYWGSVAEVERQRRRGGEIAREGQVGGFFCRNLDVVWDLYSLVGYIEEAVAVDRVNEVVLRVDAECAGAGVE